MMQKLPNYLLIFATLLAAGCSKEKPAETPAPAAKPESAIFKQEIEALDKAKALDQVTTDAIAEERKKIDAATQ